MLIAAALLVLSQADSQASRLVRPLTIDDALATFAGVRGPFVSCGDLDGDGHPEVIAAGVEFFVPTINLLTIQPGGSVRGLWKAVQGVEWGPQLVWDADGDVDADGFPDILLGMPFANEQSGAALLISGVKGEVLWRAAGERPNTFFGCSVAFDGDVDGDGRDDFVIGNARAHPAGLKDEDVVPWTGDEEPTHRPGEVVAYSGREGVELWRVRGGPPGHGFGSRIARVGNLDDDGVSDLLVLCNGRFESKATLLSGATGDVIARMKHDHGPAGPVGDFDGDGMPDLFFDSQALDSTMRGGVRVVSGATYETLAHYDNPDWGGDFGMSVGLGDLDGDGFSELAIGEPNFHIKGPGNPGFEGTAPDLSKISLTQALELTSDPWSMSYESGCLLVYSGRTRSVIWGIFGHPGSMEGIGFHAAAIPDVSGDGYPDLMVAGGDKTYVFPGPGKSGP